jgi:hypothetical protein
MYPKKHFHPRQSGGLGLKDSRLRGNDNWVCTALQDTQNLIITFLSFTSTVITFMSALNCLTTLDRAKNWVGVTTTNDDTFLTLLVEQMSRFVLSYLQRPTLFQYVFNDVYDGLGNQRQVLRHWPVQSVSLVSVDNQVIPAAPDAASAGYVVEPWEGIPPGRPQLLSLRGYMFSRGYSNVSIVYTTGYVISAEPQVVTDLSVTPNAPYGNWGADQGVRYAAGGALACVESNPAEGQYAVSDGVYTFNAADAGASVLVSYSYIPADVEHACMEMIGERYRYKNRIGEISKTLGGQETIAFSQKDMPDYLRTLLQPYKRVFGV